MIQNQRNGPRDLVDTMYARVRDIEAYGRRSDTTVPFILREYSHAMGNSSGNLAMTGARSDLPQPAGRLHLGLCGSRGAGHPHPNACATTAPQPPGLRRRLRRLPQRRQFQLQRVGVVRPPPDAAVRGDAALLSAGCGRGGRRVARPLPDRNRHFFTDLSGFDARWTYEENGEVVAQGRLQGAGRAAARQSHGRAAALDGAPSRLRGARQHVEFQFRHNPRRLGRQGPCGCPRPDRRAGGSQPAPFANVAGRAVVRLDESETAVTAEAHGFSVRIGKASGVRPACPRRRAAPTPPAPDFWRAPTDNDRGNGMAARHAVWREAACATRRAGRRSGAKVHGNWRAPASLAYPAAGETVGTSSTPSPTPAGPAWRSSLEPKGKEVPALPRIGMTAQTPGARRPRDLAGTRASRKLRGTAWTRPSSDATTCLRTSSSSVCRAAGNRQPHGGVLGDVHRRGGKRHPGVGRSQL